MANCLRNLRRLAVDGCEAVRPRRCRRRYEFTSGSEANKPRKYLPDRSLGPGLMESKSRAEKSDEAAMTATPIGRYSWVPAHQAVSVSIHKAKPN